MNFLFVARGRFGERYGTLELLCSRRGRSREGPDVQRPRTNIDEPRLHRKRTRGTVI